MIVAIPKEILPIETRVAAIPATVKELVKLGMEVIVEAGAGENAFFSDESYKEAGATIEKDTKKLFSTADMVLKVNHPVFNEELKTHEADLLKSGSVFVSLFQTTREKEAVEKLVKNKVTAFSMHLIPRSTLAQ